MSQVLFLGSDWLHNVGNNFIDKGAVALLERAGHDVDVYSTSCQDLVISDKLSKKIINLVPQPIMNRVKPVATSLSESVIEIGQKTAKEAQRETSESFEFASLLAKQYDYVAFAGMRLTPDSLSRLTSLLEGLVHNQKTELLILGAGGASYSEKEREFVKSWLQKLDPKLVITRDPDAYNYYEDSANQIFDGLDCAFFIDDAIDPPESNKRFIVKNIDRSQTPKISIDSEKEIIRTHHVISNIPDEYRHGSNIFLSSYPKEYLAIYANADMVITDRLHACIPTLVFGNRCNYMLDAPKNSLFNRIGIENPTENTIEPPQGRISEEKERQVDILTQHT